ncbi:MAG TPA: DUF4097 family beta strand repeat-containing protein [Steroidobacteraceae bacterium]|nr:DUF4097 family beta strand repeat-containing protein [Steroidobacteraceae bacterium]
MPTHRLPSLRHTLTALALLAIALPAEAWDACRYSADRRASLDATGATRVVINARAGDLEVRPTSAATVVAQGKACVSRESYLPQTDVTVRREGSTVRVDVRVPDQMAGIGIFYATLDLVVDLPASLPVEITDSSGDLTARDVRVVKVTDSSGDIVLHRPRSDVEVRDSSGDVRVEGAAGRVQVRDSSGDIVIVGAGDVVIPVDSSGDITIERVAGSVRIEQDSSGDIRVADVGRDFALLGDSSGKVRVSGVKGETRLPGD